MNNMELPGVAVPIPGPATVVTTPKGPPQHKKPFIFGGVAVLVIGIIAAIFLVQNRQLLQTAAWNCTLYNFSVSSTGTVTATNGSPSTSPPQKASVSINGSPVGIFDVPQLTAGETATIGTVTVPASGQFSWSVSGTISCTDSGSFTLPTPTPTTPVIPTITPSPTITITPPPDITPTITPSPTLSPAPTATPTSPPSDPPPAPPNRCNGECTSSANCEYGEDGTKLICIANRCRHPSCTDQESCHCAPDWPSTPTPTPTQRLPESGGISPTIVSAISGLLLLGLGLLLAI